MTTRSHLKLLGQAQIVPKENRQREEHIVSNQSKI